MRGRSNPQHTLNIFGTTTSEHTGTGTSDSSSGTDTPDVVAGSDTGSEDADRTDDADSTDGAGSVTDETVAGASAAAGPASPGPASADPTAGPAAGSAGLAGWPGLAEAAVRGGIGGRLNATGATLYLHITAADLATALGHPKADDNAAADAAGAAGGGGVRVEKLNSITLGLLRQWLQRTHSVTIRPVLDMACTDAVDQHDPPGWMREAVILRDQQCVFPGCGIDARVCDQDHIIAYQPMDAGGPPGQTHLANLACLCRRHHRMKTSRIWSYQRLPDHSYQWTSPHGHVYTTHPGHHPGSQPGTRPDRR